MNFKYLTGAVFLFPLLPLMYMQGKRIRASVPQLPEAEGNEGFCEGGEGTDRTINMISIGESTIAGVGVQTHEEGYTGAFAKHFAKQFQLNVSWKVYAKSGYTAQLVAKKLIPEITENDLDLIVIGLGANDAFKLNSPTKWNAQIRVVIESLQAKYPGAMIVFCNMPPIKEFPAFTSLIKFTMGNLVEMLGEELEKLVADYENVFYMSEKITFKKWLSRIGINAQKEDFFSDGVHPSKLTYQTWAQDTVVKMSKNETIRKALMQSKTNSASDK